EPCRALHRAFTGFCCAGLALASISRARRNDRLARTVSRPGIGLANGLNSAPVHDLSGCVLESHLEGSCHSIRGTPVKTASQTSVNNDIYHTLGDRWYKAQDDPIALLRAESRLRNPWVAEELRARFAGRALRILDVGCGGGFLSNYLAAQG